MGNALFCCLTYIYIAAWGAGCPRTRTLIGQYLLDIVLVRDESTEMTAVNGADEHDKGLIGGTPLC